MLNAMKTSHLNTLDIFNLIKHFYILIDTLLISINNLIKLSIDI